MAVICITTGGTEQIRVCVSRYSQSTQNRRQKMFIREALCLCRKAWYWKFVRISTDLYYSVSYFNLRALGLCLVGRIPTKLPRGDGTKSTWIAN